MPGRHRGRHKRGLHGEEASGGEEIQRALSYAFKLLGYRQRSDQELTRRLVMKGFSDQTVGEVARRLRESGYVNDRATASALRLRAEEGKHLGLSGAKQFLRQMGISRGDAEDALEGYDEMASAMRLAEKKSNIFENTPPAEAKKRLSGYLRRRGFSYATIKKTIDAHIKEEK